MADQVKLDIIIRYSITGGWLVGLVGIDHRPAPTITTDLADMTDQISVGPMNIVSKSDEFFLKQKI